MLKHVEIRQTASRVDASSRTQAGIEPMAPMVDERGHRGHDGPLAGLLTEAAKHDASDLLLIADTKPTIYARGQWSSLVEETMSAEDVTTCLEAVLSDAQRARLYEVRDLDFGFTLPRIGRYRANIHYQRGTLAAAFRAIPIRVPSFERLGLPAQILEFANFPSGLVLVTGGTGQGKSTTLAAVIDHMSRTRSDHVITIEDPIEFAFNHGTCLIEQRQIGEDSPSFASALRHVLRQRPDVILIGEMRDLETVATALTAAETGHLVLASLHTSSAAQTLARIIDVFPSSQQPQIRTQLAASLRAIVCQALVRDRLNDALTPATEILVATSAISRAIRDNETHLIYSMVETGKRQGMHTLEQSLVKLVRTGRADARDAFAVAANPQRLEKLIGQPHRVVSTQRSEIMTGS
ncbi:MAG: PilT/PilU family type 4a pilus ATPase [Phycisphaerae bacterium]|nr:PilT/PilU family type 4a pilus ATPase [Phycisphaerae bacterium]